MADGVISLILGGGRGTRLFPLTKYRSKPAVPLAGKFRLVDVPVSNSINSGLRNIFVLTQFNSASLNSHINTTYKFDHFHPGFVNILAAEQTMDNIGWFQGTADAVRKMYVHVRPFDPKHVLILYGDQLYRMDYRLLMDTHTDQSADLTIALHPVSEERVREFGVAVLREDGTVTGIVEKPTETANLRACGRDEATGRQLYPAFTGIYLFNRECLERLLFGSECDDLVRDVLPVAFRDFRVCSYMFHDYWEDIGTISSFYRINMELASGTCSFDFQDPRGPILGCPHDLPEARIVDGRVKSCIICEGARVDRAHIENSVVGIRSVISEAAHLENVVMMGADYYQEEFRGGRGAPGLGIGSNCVIRRAIIDKNARIGAEARILGAEGAPDEDAEGYYVRDGIVIIPKDAVIEEGRTISAG